MKTPNDFWSVQSLSMGPARSKSKWNKSFVMMSRDSAFARFCPRHYTGGVSVAWSAVMILLFIMRLSDQHYTHVVSADTKRMIRFMVVPEELGGRVGHEALRAEVQGAREVVWILRDAKK